MTADPAAKVSADEYLVFEESAETRHEFVDGSIVAMLGGTYSHAQIVDNLVFELTGQLKGKSCRITSTNVRVKAELTESYFYPDLLGICGTPVFENDKQLTVLNPVILFEVLSPSAEPFDRGKKFMHYQQIPTLKEYVLIAQTHHAVEIFSRGLSGEWTYRSHLAPEDTARFESIGCTVQLADIYRDVTLMPLKEAD